MPNIQQPEMRRSGHDPLVQDSAKARAEHQGTGRERRGPVPEDQVSPYGGQQPPDERRPDADAEPDAILHGGPRGATEFRAEQSALVTLEAAGLIHRYIRTNAHEIHDGRQLRVYTYDGEVRPGAR